jgi:hypothetical protein
VKAEGGLNAAVRTRIERAEHLRAEAAAAAGKKPPRKRRADAVLSVDQVLSASPEYFRPDAPDATGTWDQERLDAWVELNTDWLKAKHGDNLVSVVLHLDEATPHIHAVFVPLTADGRLSAKEVLDNLAALQTEYALVVAPLGIQRGMEGSTATHTDVKTFYSAVNKALNPPLPPIAVSTPPMTTIVTGGGKQWAKVEGERLEAKVGEVVREAEARSQMAELEREKVRRAPATLDRLRTSTGEAHEATLRATRAQQAAEAREQAIEAREQGWRELVQDVRATPLSTVLEAAGLEIDLDDRKQWLGPNSRITVEGEKFYDHKQGRGGGGAIDLAKHLSGLTRFQDVLAWMGREISQAAVAETLRAEANRVEPELPPPFVMPEPAEALWPDARDYLVKRRGLPARTVDALKAAGKIVPAVTKGALNAVFRMTCPWDDKTVGGEVRGTGDRKWRGLVGGSSRNRGAFRLQRGRQDQPRLVHLTESAIDAISLYELAKPKADWGEVFISTAGARGSVPWLADELGPQDRLVVAFDADEAGEDAWDMLRRAYPKAQRWKAYGEDWNADLIERAEQQEAAGLALPGPEPEEGPAPDPDRPDFP